MGTGMADDFFAVVVKGVVNDYHYLKSQGWTHEQIASAIQLRLQQTANSSYIPANREAFQEQITQIGECLLEGFAKQLRTQNNWTVEPKSPSYEYSSSSSSSTTYIFVENTSYGYNQNSDLFFNLLMLNALTSHHHCHHHSMIGYGSSSCLGGMTNCNGKDGEKALATLALLALAAAAVFSAVLATLYLLNHFLNSLERLWFNEGMLRAILLMGASLGAGFMAATLSPFVIAYPLMALTAMAGFSNPIGWIILGSVSLGLIGAAVACFATNQILNHHEKKSHEHSFDPANAHRFKLTDREEAYLKEKNIDPVAVKVAIVLLNSNLQLLLNSNPEKMQDKRIPSIFNRHLTSSGREVNAILSDVRALRQGKMAKIEVNGLAICCASKQHPYYFTHSY